MTARTVTTMEFTEAELRARVAQATGPHPRDVIAASVFLAGLRAEPWLCAAIADRLQGGAYALVAAWGLAARHGVVERRLTLAEMLDLPHPCAGALEWLAARPEVLPAALAWAPKAITALGTDIPGDRGALAWLHARDDAESVTFVLQAAGLDVAPLRAMLDDLDARAKVHPDLAGEFDDNLLSRLAWGDPVAWWGRSKGRVWP